MSSLRLFLNAWLYAGDQMAMTTTATNQRKLVVFVQITLRGVLRIALLRTVDTMKTHYEFIGQIRAPKETWLAKLDSRLRCSAPQLLISAPPGLFAKLYPHAMPFR